MSSPSHSGVAIQLFEPLFRRGTFDGVVDEPVEPKLLRPRCPIVVVAARLGGGQVEDALQPADSMISGPLTVALSRLSAKPSGLENWPPVQSSWPPMWAPSRCTSPVAENPSPQSMLLVDGEPVGAEGGAVGVGELAPRAVELAADVGTQQAHFASGREPVATEHASVDGEPVSIEGATAWVGEVAPSAVELATNVGTQQAHLAGSGEPPAQTMSPSTVSLSALRAAPSGLENWPPCSSSWPPMWAPSRRTSPVAANPCRSTCLRRR